MLNVVDVFSKYAWSIPLKDKTASTVLDAFKRIAKESGRKPNYIWVDEGKEFYNKDMTAWLNENNIVRYSTHGEHKSAVVERFNRTLKTNMWRRFTAENTRNWIDMLDRLMLEYNNAQHSTIRMRPVDAILKENHEKAWSNIFENLATIPHRKPKYKVGDSVRISRIKGIFEKGYLPNWSEELYKVYKVNKSEPPTYLLKDLKDDKIEGAFYKEEIQPAEQEIFRIEKVVRKKKINGIEHGLVKWIGYSHKFNEWIPMKEIQKT